MEFEKCEFPSANSKQAAVGFVTFKTKVLEIYHRAAAAGKR
jgi:hypothetical protein